MIACDEQDERAVVEQEKLHRITAGLDSLPRLTCAVLLIHRLDDLPYDQVAWRCGISVDEVTLRMADALSVIRWAADGRTALMGRVCRWLVPWRLNGMRWRMRQMDRRLGL